MCFFSAKLPENGVNEKKFSVERYTFFFCVAIFGFLQQNGKRK
jgi:phage terminase large subunit-like protein